MTPRDLKSQNGQTLIEVIFALIIFFIFISGTLMLTFRSLKTTARGIELNQAKQIETSTWEALQAIAYDNWSALTNGTFGLTSASGKWALQAAADITADRYTRSITVASVMRNASSCAMVESGGTNDPDTKKITLALNWTAEPTNQSVIGTRYITNWKSPTFSCAVTEAGKLVMDTSDSEIDETRKSIVDTYLRNTSAVPITIDKMTLSWTKPGLITFIKINGQNYWHSTNGTGTPQGAQPSGTELDLVDFTLAAGHSYEIDNIRFDSKIDGSTVTITAIMSDGSRKTEVTTPPFIP